MSAELSVKTEGSMVSELRSNVVAKIPANQINVYSSENIHSDLILGNEKQSEIIISTNDDTNGNFTQTGFIFNGISQDNACYSTCMMLESDLVIELSNIKTKENLDMLACLNTKNTNAITYTYQYKHEDEADTAIKPLNLLPNGSFNTYEGGNAFPITNPVFGPKCNILNSMCSSISVTLGSNSNPVVQSINDNPTSVEVKMRQLSADFTQRHYDGALCPNQCMNKQYILPEPLKRKQFELAEDANKKQTWTFKTDNIICHQSPFSTYEQLENDSTNALSGSKRGQLFLKEGVRYDLTSKGETLTDFKSVSSTNLTIDLVTGVVSEVPKSKELFPVKTLDGHVFLSNYNNAQKAYDSGKYGYHDLKWCTNGVLHVMTTKAANVVTHTFILEPLSQAFSCNIYIPAVRSPIFNQLLSVADTASFARASKLEVKLLKNANYSNLIDTQFKFDQGFDNGGSTSNIHVRVTTKNNTLRIKQYQNSLLNSYINKQINLPFLETKYADNKTIDFPKLQTEKRVTKRFRFQNSEMSEIPRFQLIYFDKPNAIIKKLITYINNNADIYTNISDSTLYNATRQNGMIQYSQHDATSQGYGNKWSKVNKNTLINYGCGSIYLLEYGNQIPTQEPQLMAGLTDVSLKYTIEIDVEYTYNGHDTEAVTCYIENIMQSYYGIKDSNSQIMPYGFTVTDIGHAYKKIVADISSGSLYINARKFFGGALSMASKVNSVIPKTFQRKQEHKRTLDNAPVRDNKTSFTGITF